MAEEIEETSIRETSHVDLGPSQSNLAVSLSVESKAIQGGRSDWLYRQTACLSGENQAA